MLLRNVFVLGQKDMLQDLSWHAAKTDTLSVDCNGSIVFPGLVNSHDHLDFNLFPALGNRLYNNYTEWGKDIHTHHKKTIQAVERIPVTLRTQWGMYKNLLNGFTTVVNHGKKLAIENEWITVLQHMPVLHSVAFEKNWRLKLNDVRKRKYPYVIHTGEGTDAMAHDEIDTLLRWNVCRKELIGIHGVAMTTRQAAHFKALVWCPASNFFLLGESAQVGKLGTATTILFGTDSTLTAEYNHWNQLRTARATNSLSDQSLLDTVTRNAQKIWNLDPSVQDMVVARRNNGSNLMDAFFAINPEDLLLILHKGTIRLFDQTMLEQLWPALHHQTFSKIKMEGTIKYVAGDLPGLIHDIRKYNPDISFPVTVA